VSTAGKSTYSDLRLEEIARITAAIATGNVPLEFLVQVRAENPSTNSVTARLLQLGWTLYLDESRVLDGKLDRGYSFEPGKPVLVPVAVSLDAYDIVGRSGVTSSSSPAIATEVTEEHHRSRTRRGNRSRRSLPERSRFDGTSAAPPTDRPVAAGVMEITGRLDPSTSSH
jgi:hypothetical protein